MVRNAEKLEMATQFRKRGFSYSEIAKICGVSKSTVSVWLAKKQFSKRVKKENAARAARENVKRMQLLNKARTAERSARYKEAVRSAEIEYRHYKNSPLFMAGLMLYRGLGDMQHPQQLRLSNADFDTHRIFIKFAKEFLGVSNEQIRFWLLLYPDLSERVCVSTWNKKLRLARGQWHKNQVLAVGATKKTLQYGVGNTIIGSTVLKRKLMKWLELASKEL